MQHTHLGYELMLNVLLMILTILGKVEVQPKFEGRQIIMIVSQPLASDYNFIVNQI